MAYNSGSGNPIGAKTGPVSGPPPEVGAETKMAVAAAVEAERKPKHLVRSEQAGTGREAGEGVASKGTSSGKDAETQGS